MGEPGRLVVVATPIGNLDDLSPRAVAALRAADVVACEDTRRTATLLRHADATTPMVSSHEHNEVARAPELVARMLAGDTVALVSDAGMPVISDPGARVIAAAVAAGVAVTVVPGPSAVEAALVASGLPSEPFAFVGFFPRRTLERRELFARWAGFTGSLVGFESPHRLAGLLADLADVDADRPVAVCRELTKVHEEIVRGAVGSVAATFADGARGEVTVVIGPGSPPVPVDDTDHVISVLAGVGLGPKAIADVASTLGLAPRNATYRAALAAVKRNAT